MSPVHVNSYHKRSKRYGVGLRGMGPSPAATGRTARTVEVRDPEEPEEEITPLEEYRRGVVTQWARMQNWIKRDLMGEYPEIEDVRLVGSVTDPDEFRSDSDIDVGVFLKEGTSHERIADIYESLRHQQIMLGEGTVDWVMHVGGRFVHFYEG